MPTYTKITTVLRLMLIGMCSPGLAAEKSTENTNGLYFLISGSPMAHTANNKALQQQATDINISKLAADGHRLCVIDQPVRTNSTQFWGKNMILTKYIKSAYVIAALLYGVAFLFAAT